MKTGEHGRHFMLCPHMEQLMQVPILLNQHISESHNGVIAHK